MLLRAIKLLSSYIITQSNSSLLNVDRNNFGPFSGISNAHRKSKSSCGNPHTNWWMRVMDDFKRQPRNWNRVNLVAGTLWKLWHNCNLRVFKGTSCSVVSILSMATELIS
ncbi:hypothetical protein PIB30_080700 [Stylosanthes scabra]|uniref:Uncharacterized protein n=1 Tax=Stylosanthes scabra TaxID=79078 RepID=A0ABU6RSD6_9FABA|nr:hypothetical protein [Stylosanthes scabra]